MASDGLYLVVPEKGARLFVGTQKAAQDRSLLRRHRVSRIVCVGTPAFHQGDDDEVHSNGSKNISYLEVDILDLPSENLLGRLDSCVSFIEEGMSREENVLVNCVYAQSRSPTVVAAYLMRLKGLSVAQAIELVQEAQPTVHINPGFQAQLDLYSDLGCRLPATKKVEIGPTAPSAGGRGVAPEEPIGISQESKPSTNTTTVWAAATYRWFLFACGLNLGGGFGGEGGHNGAFHGGEGCGRLYRCKACRAPLFRDSNVLDHLHPVVQAASDSTFASFSKHGDGSSWIKARDAADIAAAGSTKTVVRGAKGRHDPTVRRGGGATHSNNNCGKSVVSSAGKGMCTSVFTEALDWVVVADRGRHSGHFAHSSGKICCPGKKGTVVCGSKLGAWSLDGINCSCGRLVKPAFQFTLSRIERV
ncbi:conserved unknown protein [Ectocarpus siliculosus]|uniref:protein-tyrosine-phosphatase n=1 Tax=Ectocarpus siliculosus TaxID=2880 RepID=D7FJF1_ECTSI|nr:conserved unknown protein [Ectocarpus siliculosus]|eukprot:CBJ29054.1 conserved unknown protein [Ectocarpus siliculosus]